MKRTLTGIAAASMILGMTVPAAFASTSGPNYNQRTISVGSYSVGAKGIAAKDPWSGKTTEFMPVFYLQQGLKALGSGWNATWNGTNHTLSITTPSGSTTGLTKVTPGNGTVISINGVPVVNAPKQLVAKDPASGKWTSYLPIYYFVDALKMLGFTSSYNGTAGTWTVTAPVAPTLAVTGAPSSDIAVGTQEMLGLTANGTAVTSGVKWSVSGTGAVVDNAGDFVASAPGTYTVTATYGGQTATQTIVVYGAVAGLQVSAASSTVVANNASLDKVTVTAVDANGNVVSDYSGTVTVGLSGNAASLATGSDQNSDLSGNTLTLSNGTGTVVLKAGTVPGLSTEVTATSPSVTDSNGIQINSSATVKSVAQVATAVSVSPESKYLPANGNGSSNAADTAKVDVGVVDQTGNPMLTGSYGITLNVSGPATFADGTTGPENISVSGSNTDTVTLDALKGETGTVTVTASSSGLTTGTGNLMAIIGQNPAALVVNPTTSGVTSFTEGAGNSVSYTASATDANGAPATYDFSQGTVKVYVTNSKGDVASNIKVNGTAESSDGVAVTSPTFNLSDDLSGADAGTYTVVVKDTASTSPLAAAPAFTFTENAAAASTYTLTPSSTQVSVSSPSVTETIQTADKFGNAVAPSSPVTFKVTAADQGTGYGTATINGVDAGTGVYVKTDASGSAMVSFEAQPYVGANWTISAVPQNSTTFTMTKTANVSIVNTVTSAATASVVDKTDSSPTNGTAGDWLSYTFGAQDSLGNAIASGDQFTATYDPSDFVNNTVGTAGSSNTLSNGDIALTGTLTQLNGDFSHVQDKAAGTVTVTLADATMSSASSASASIYMSAGPQDTSQYDLFNANGTNVTLNGISTTANTPVELWLKPVDQYGNPVVSTVSTLVELSHPDGGTFRATESGSATSDFQINQGSYGVPVWYVNPLTKTYSAAAVGTPVTSLAFAPTLSSASVTAGSQLTVSGTLTDNNSNPVADQTVKVSFDGVSGTATTDGTGAYSVILTPTKAVSGGQVTVSADGMTDTSQSATVTAAAPANATISTAFTTSSTAAPYDYQGVVTVTDQYGNPVSGVTNWNVVVNGSYTYTVGTSGGQYQVVDNGDGTYSFDIYTNNTGIPVSIQAASSTPATGTLS